MDWVCCIRLQVLIYNDRMRMLEGLLQVKDDLRRPDRRTPMKVLTAKTYKFVDDIWKAYLNYIMQDHTYDHIRLVAKKS